MSIALRIDVATLRGAEQGVPRLLDMLARHQVGATFFFNLGPDRVGHMPWRWLRRRGLGVGSWLKSRLVPARSLDSGMRQAMQAAKAAGCEVAVGGVDAPRWLYQARQQNMSWTESLLCESTGAFETLMGEVPRGRALPLQRLNRTAVRLAQRHHFSYSSDTLGLAPYWPVIDGEPVRCPQIPITLPNFDQLHLPGRDAVADILHDSQSQTLHVYAGEAELEGMALSADFERLLAGWKEQGHRIASLVEYVDALDLTSLPYHEVELGPTQPSAPARQGRRFPA